MKILKTNLVIVLAVLTAAAAAHAESIRDGFMGTKWTADITSLEGFSKLYSKNDVDFYINPQKVYQIGNYTVREIVYGFHKGKFFAVYIQIKEMEIFSDIKRYMKSTYGDPQISFSMKSDEVVDRWKTGTVKIKLKNNRKTGKMKLAFYYKALSAEINEELQEKFSEEAVRVLPVDKKKKPQALPLLTF
jgi:hypothetical protein